MKNYNIIFNGEVIQTIKSSSFSRNEFGSIAFKDKGGETFCVIPKEYAFVETDIPTREEAILDNFIDYLNWQSYNDVERDLPSFKELKSFHESKKAELVKWLEELKSNLKR